MVQIILPWGERGLQEESHCVFNKSIYWSLKLLPLNLKPQSLDIQHGVLLIFLVNLYKDCLNCFPGQKGACQKGRVFHMNLFKENFKSTFYFFFKSILMGALIFGMLGNIFKYRSNYLPWVRRGLAKGVYRVFNSNIRKAAKMFFLSYNGHKADFVHYSFAYQMLFILSQWGKKRSREKQNPAKWFIGLTQVYIRKPQRFINSKTAQSFDTFYVTLSTGSTQIIKVIFIW